MKKLFALFLLVLLAVSACDYLDVSVIDSQTVIVNGQAVYPITLTNTGLGKQFVSLYANCPSNDVSCSFDPQPSYVELESTESALFNLIAIPSESGEYELDLDITAGYGFDSCTSKQLLLVALTEEPEEVDEPFTITIEPESLNASGWAGDELLFIIKIQNNLFDTGYAELEAIGAFEETTHFSSSALTIPAKDFREVKAFVTFPPGTPGGFYDSIFRIRTTLGGSCCEEFYEIPLHSCVFAKELNLELLNEPMQCVDIDHNEVVEWRLGVRNDGRINGPFNVFIEGSDEVQEFISINPTRFEVVSGDKQYLTISIAPDKDVVLDQYYFSLGLRYLGFDVFQQPFCINVHGVENFSIESDDEYLIRRCQVETIPFTIKNTGTLMDDYEIELEEIPGMLVQAVPATFSLSPGESKKVELVLSTSLNTAPELGDYDLSVIVRSPRLSKRIVFPMTLIPSEFPGESFLNIRETMFEVHAGVPSTFKIHVLNSKETTLRAVELRPNVLDDGWFVVKTDPQDIPAGSEVEYEVSFYAPSNEAGKHDFSLSAIAFNGEAITVNSTLKIIQGLPELDFSVSGIEYYGPSEDRQVVVSIVVTNAGPTQVNGIETEDAKQLSQPSSLSLEPGESKSMIVSFKGEPGTRIPIKLTSSLGAVTKAVEVVVEPPESPRFTWLPFAILSLIFLLAAYSWYAYKGVKEEKNAMQPPTKFVENDAVAEERLEKYEKEVEDTPTKVKPKKNKKKTTKPKKAKTSASTKPKAKKATKPKKVTSTRRLDIH